LNESDFVFSFSDGRLFFSPFCYDLKIRYVIFRVFTAFVVLQGKEKIVRSGKKFGGKWKGRLKKGPFLIHFNP
jgi:hypothetical protein